MVAPSKNFTAIADSSIDSDSPLTTGLMISYRDNDIHLEEWLGDGFTAAKDHDHDGVNSKGLVGASLVFLERKVVTGSAITSFDFAVSLNGDTDKLYWLVGKSKNAVVGANGLKIRINSGGSSLLIVTLIPNQGTGHFQILLTADSTVFRAITGTVTKITDIGGLSAVALIGVAVPSAEANITSLGFEVETASAMDVGSEFTLYKMKVT